MNQLPLMFNTKRVLALLWSPPFLAMLSLLLLCIALFFLQLDGYSLFNITEAKQAEIARQIWVRGDWVTPVYNGEVYYDKPVLLHWLIALGFSLVGMNEWAVRLPSAISATALIAGTWWFASQVANQRMALLMATLLAANPFTFALGRTGHHDMLMTCFMTIALYCWYLAYSTGQTHQYRWFFGLLALAVFVKGPLALALAGLTIAIFLIWVGRWKEHLAMVPWRTGILIFGVITLPWYGLMLYANGWNFIHNFLVFNNVDRFLSPNLNQAGPWYYYLPLVLLGFFPWMIGIPAALVRGDGLRSLQCRYWRHYRRQRLPGEDLSLFMTIWCMTVLVFMSIAATKLPWYVYPGFPPLAYLAAQAWEAQMPTPDRWFHLGIRAIAGVYLGVAIGLGLAPEVVPSNLVWDSIVDTGVVRVWAIAYLIAAVGMGMSSVCRQTLWAWLINLVVFGCFALPLTNHLLPAIDQQVLGGQLLPIAAILQREVKTTPSMPMALGVSEPSLNFYSRLSYIYRFEEPFQPLQIQQQLQQPHRILLVTTDTALQQAHLDLSHYLPLSVSGRYKIFVIPPNR